MKKSSVGDVALAENLLVFRVLFDGDPQSGRGQKSPGIEPALVLGYSGVLGMCCRSVQPGAQHSRHRHKARAAIDDSIGLLCRICNSNRRRGLKVFPVPQIPMRSPFARSRRRSGPAGKPTKRFGFHRAAPDGCGLNVATLLALEGSFFESLRPCLELRQQHAVLPAPRATRSLNGCEMRSRPRLKFRHDNSLKVALPGGSKHDLPPQNAVVKIAHFRKLHA